MGDPLFDTLFRPTTIAAETAPAAPVASEAPEAPVMMAVGSIASAAPVRQIGTRSRAGNAMGRTRAAVLAGARRAVQVSGTKITMAQVATASGVAKATLYNHFRTRDAVLSALLVDEVTVIVDACAGRSLHDALSTAANSIAQSPTLARLAELEPSTVAQLGRIELACEGWLLARNAVSLALATDSRGGADLVLRWLASYLLSPANEESIAADIAILVAALPDVPAARHEETVVPSTVIVAEASA
jgi:AcrR family transcriptional regulator